MTKEISNLNRQSLRLFLVGTVLFAVYYLADCALDSVLFGDGTFRQNLLSPSAHEVAIRTLSGLCLFCLYIVASYLLDKNRALQRALLEKSQDLLDKNRELETYNHALSTHLHFSLTTIMLSVERLKFTCIASDAPRTVEMLGQLNWDCKQLSAQFKEMTGLAAINRVELARQRTALDEIARQIAADLERQNGGRPVEIRIDRHMEVECDPALMQVALKNLICCGLDSASLRQNPVVRVGMRRPGGFPLYFVRHLRRREGATRHSAAEPAAGATDAPNTIGIKTARSIIERHGGQLWAKGAGNAAPDFYFSL